MEQAELLWSNSHERPLYGGEFYRTLLQWTISVISLIFETVQNLPKKWGAGGGCPHCDFRLQKGHNAIFFLALALTLTLLRCRRVIFTSMIYSQLHPHLHTHTHTHFCRYAQGIAVLHQLCNLPPHSEYTRFPGDFKNCVISIYFGAMSQIFIKFHGDSDTNMTLNDLL